MRITGIPQLESRLRAVGNVQPLLMAWQIRTVREAKLRVARKTGFTGRTIRPGVRTGQYAEVDAGGAAPFLEFGTKPHIIRPKNRRVLAWAAEPQGRRLSGRPRAAARRGGLGGMRFATIVHHPGTKAQPFLLPAAVDALRQVGADGIITAWNSGA